MNEINLVKFNGKPLEKLIDVISNGIGTLYKPRAIRKEAEAKAYKIELIERAKSKALAEGKEIEAETYQRIQERILHQETKRQHNVDNISQIATEQINQVQTVSNEPVDDDWITRFFNIAQDVSDEEMQNLWGRILAGEVKQPKSYSYRTLELLKNLSRQEAEIFTKVANFTISNPKINFIFKGKNNELTEKFHVEFDDIAKLTEIGLLHPREPIIYDLLQETKDGMHTFNSGTTAIIVNKKANTPRISIPIYSFTNSGNEILKLISIKPPFGYLTSFAKFIRKENVSVKYAQILEITEEYIRHSVPLLDFPV